MRKSTRFEEKLKSRAPFAETTLQALLRLEITPLTKTGVISRAFDNFALSRIKSGKPKISRQELMLLQEKFGPKAIMFLRSRRLKVEPALRTGRNTGLSRRTFKQIEGLKPKKRAGIVDSAEIQRKASKAIGKMEKKYGVDPNPITWWKRRPKMRIK